jgi:hypothetical protein
MSSHRLTTVATHWPCSNRETAANDTSTSWRGRLFFTWTFFRPYTLGIHTGTTRWTRVFFAKPLTNAPVAKGVATHERHGPFNSVLHAYNTLFVERCLPRCKCDIGRSGRRFVALQCLFNDGMDGVFLFFFDGGDDA